MDAAKKAMLEAAGYWVGEFLGLSEEENQPVEARLENKPVFTLSTGKVINCDKIKSDNTSKDQSKGSVLVIFDDDSEMYFTSPEWVELTARHQAWDHAGDYNGNYVDADFTINREKQ